MSELTRKMIATQERQELEPIASKDRDKVEAAGAVERSFAGESPDTITENSTVPSMAFPPSATTPPERATAGILVSDNYVIHPWVGPVELEPPAEEELESLAEHGVPADAKRVALSVFSEKVLAFGPYAPVDQSLLLLFGEGSLSDLRRRAVEDLVENECVLVESEGPEGAPRTVNGKKLRLRPWVLSIGWAQEGALPKWVFTYIKQLDSVFVHEPSRTVLAVWGPYTGQAIRSGVPNLDPEAGQSETPLTEVEERDVRIVRELLTLHPMGSASLLYIAQKLGLSPHETKAYLVGLTTRLNFVYYAPGKTVRIYELAKARMWLLARTEGSPRRR